jgi:hypothetical protein
MHLRCIVDGCLVVVDGNSSRSATSEEIRDALRLDNCKSEFCEEEFSSISEQLIRI